MIKPLIEKINKLIDSEEFESTMTSIAYKQGLDEDQSDRLASVTKRLLLGEINEDSFAWHIADRCDITLVAADVLAREISFEILVPLKKELSQGFGEVSPVLSPAPVQSTVVQPQPIAPQPQPIKHIDSLNRNDILAHIENPPRSVLKRYVIEQESIKDPEHLIEDTVDKRPRLEDHYND